MVLQKRKGKGMILLKSFTLLISCLSFFGILSCNNSGTNSTASSSSNSGTSAGWSISIGKFTSPVSISKGESALVVMRVKDATGAPAPKGTRVCFSVSFGSIFVDEVTDEAVRTGCHVTSNDRGEAMGNYHPPAFTGTDFIQASSMGAIDSTSIEVVP